MSVSGMNIADKVSAEMKLFIIAIDLVMVTLGLIIACK